jgi:nitrile hydratase subunit beta
MNGVHDLGGMHGFGPIEREANEPVFHHNWERRVYGVMWATFAGGHYGVDEFRHAVERMGAAQYLTTSYYEHWLTALETLMQERGVITRDELAAKWAALSKGAA